MTTTFADLKSYYRSKYCAKADQSWREELRAVARQVAQGRIAKLTDAVVIASVVHSVAVQGELKVDDLPPAVREAFSLAYPNVDLQSLDGMSADELSGYMNAWQGKLFEVVVRDELNAGEAVGDWHLEAGQTAQIAESANQPGWDLAILNSKGDVIQHLQLKATDSVSYIQEALDRYPNIPIIATADQSEALAHLESVSTAGTLTDDLTSNMGSDQLAEGGVVASDALLPGTVILATEALAVASGNKTWEEAIEDGGKRLGVSAVAGVGGAVVATLFGGVLGVAAAIALRYWLAKESQITESVQQSTGRYRETGTKISRYNNTEAVDATVVSPRSGGVLTTLQLEWLKGHYPQEFKFSLEKLNGRFWTRENGNQIWAGQLGETGAVLLYDPLIQVPDDNVVWVFSIQQECLRPFLREELRSRIVKFKNKSKQAKFTSTYLVWIRGCFPEALKHIEALAYKAGERPAFPLL